MTLRSRVILIIFGIVAALMVLLLSGPTIRWQNDSITSSIATAKNIEDSNDYFFNCRYGVTLTKGEEVPSVSKIGAGLYLSFQPYPPAEGPANGAKFAHVIQIKQERGPNNSYLPSWYSNPALDSAFASYVNDNRGEKYLLGNEIERQGQGDIFPDMYALAYHDVYHFIKNIDPTAQIAISGLVEVTPMRTQYLDMVWDTYLETFGTHMPVDIWNMHLYPIPEVIEVDGELKQSRGGAALGTDRNLGKRESDGTSNDCNDPRDNIYCYAEHDNMDMFTAQITLMRQWMKDHGQQNKPLIISEYSILWPYIVDEDGCYLMDEFGKCFDPDRISKFLLNGFDRLNNTKSTTLGYPADDYRLVQQWVWYSIYQEPGQAGSSSNLFEKDLVTLTKMGRAYRDYVASENSYRNLVVDRVSGVPVPAQPDNDATTQISVVFRNNGNISVQKPFDVTFYSNSSLTSKIGTVRIDPEVAGCATASYEATVEWSGLNKGAHKFWVVVDSGAEIQEVPTNNVDNTGVGKVIVYSDRAYLTIVRAN